MGEVGLKKAASTETPVIDRLDGQCGDTKNVAKRRMETEVENFFTLKINEFWGQWT